MMLSAVSCWPKNDMENVPALTACDTPSRAELTPEVEPSRGMLARILPESGEEKGS